MALTARTVGQQKTWVVDLLQFVVVELTELGLNVMTGCGAVAPPLSRLRKLCMPAVPAFSPAPG